MIRRSWVKRGGKERSNERVYSVDLGLSKRGSARQGEPRCEQSIGIAAQECARAGEHRLLVHGLPERATFDIGKIQHGRQLRWFPLGDYLVNQNCCEPAVVLEIQVLLEDRHSLDIREKIAISFPQASAPRDHLIEPLQLRESKCGQDVA